MRIARWFGFLAAAGLGGCGGQSQQGQPQAPDAASRVSDGDVVEASAPALDSAGDIPTDAIDASSGADVGASPAVSADSGTGADDATEDSAARDSGGEQRPSDGSPTDDGASLPQEDAATCDGEVGAFYCVTDCLNPFSTIDTSSCSDGLWICPSGYIPVSACPADGCGVTSDFCCDPVTGMEPARACDDAGYRQDCPEGTRPAGPYDCIPEALGITDCISLAQEPEACASPAVSCQSQDPTQVVCTCSAQDGGIGLWNCTAWSGG